MPNLPGVHKLQAARLLYIASVEGSLQMAAIAIVSGTACERWPIPSWWPATPLYDADRRTVQDPSRQSGCSRSCATESFDEQTDEEDARDTSLQLPLALSVQPSVDSAQLPTSCEDSFPCENHCNICFESVANVVFVPCGHLGFCSSCCTSLQECPICRESISYRQQGFCT
mmetsp:Transcript_102589/g.162074  ORF Transcript_102589/g.162074 Transcript_102589/m.162074 type:complete len:171 (+) Transcript_102589:261-773(+)